MIRILRLNFLMLLFTGLFGCSSLPRVSLTNEEVQPIPLQSLYLRGVFNWWEASENFRFKNNDQEWSVDVDLIADGQPYDFKVSDATWSPEHTCGASNQPQTLQLGVEIYLSCGVGVETLRFTPGKTGKFRFTVSHASRNELRLVIMPTNI